MDYPTLDVLVVAFGSAVYEVPLIDTYVEKVDLDARLVTLRTLDGLEPEPQRGPQRGPQKKKPAPKPE